MKKLFVVLLCCSVFVVGCNNFKNNDVIENLDEGYNESDIDDRYILDLDEIDDSDVPKLKLPKDVFLKQAKQELEENKNYSKALILLNRIEEIEKKDPLIYYEIGKVQIKLHNINEAIESFTKAIELENKATYYEARAEAYSLIGDSELARLDMAEVQKLQRDNK